MANTGRCARCGWFSEPARLCRDCQIREIEDICRENERVLKAMQAEQEQAIRAILTQTKGVVH